MPSKVSVDEATDVVSRWSKEELPEKIAALLDKAFADGWEACQLETRLSILRRRVDAGAK